MDFLKAPPPRPPIGVIDSDLVNVVKESYGIFIDSGGSPDSYIISDVNNFINDTLFNGTFNGTDTSIRNGTGHQTNDDVAELIIMAVTSIILGLMILITVIGNVFVIAAIILERNLQNVANYLVASLAVADLFVACLVMPLGAVYEISQGWILGPELCDIWTSCDVLCCTASILHLVAIATDRYWAVTNVDYIHSRTSGRVFMMIFLVWVSAVIVSLAPQFGWKDPEYMQRIEQQKCMVSQDVSYQVFATCSTFYVPLLVILVLYWKIYQTARKRIHRRRPKQIVSANNNQVVPPKAKSRLRYRIASKFTSNGQGKSVISSIGLVEGNSTNTVNTVEDTDYSSNEKKGVEVTTFNSKNGGTDNEVQPSSATHILTVSHHVANNQTANTVSGYQHSHQNNQILTPIVQNQILSIEHQCQHDQHTIHHKLDQLSLNTQHSQNPFQLPSQLSTPVQHASHVPSGSTANPHTQVKTRKETLEAKRERKAAKTLAIITGAFVVCWLPFFLMALLLPLFESWHINDKIASLFLWLGYFNSTLNPVIYTIFSPEFRQAFKRILFGHHRTGYYRGGKL